MTNQVVLPWPPSELSPNARVHWATRARATKVYRTVCAWECKAAGLKSPSPDGRILLHMTFIPPSRRHFDDDNLVARCKGARDGIADALGINDRRFRVVPEVVTDRIGGFVVVRLEAA